MENKLWKFLQLFADVEGSGEGAAEASESGVMADDADQRLRDMGVPEDKIRRTRAGRQRARQAVPVTEAPATQAAAADMADDGQPEAQEEEKPKRMTWDEIKKDPEFNLKMQETIQDRVKAMQERLNAAKAAEESLNALMPAIKKIAQEKGLDTENVDYVSLGKMLTGEYESKAMELGVPVETVMQLEQQQRTIEQQKIENHFARLEREAEDLRKVFPNFSLQAEMANPAFAKLTHPNIGMSVEDAYYAVHRKELQVASMQVAAQRTAQQISNAIQSGTRRPVESGQSTQAPSVTTFDYSRATKAQRDEFKAKLRASWARGEKVYPGR